MPMFVFLSGLFAANSMQLDVVSLIKKKINQLIYPSVVFWLIDCGLILGTRLLLDGYNVKCDDVYSFYWFFKMLFLCILIAYFGTRIFKEKKLVGFVIITFLLIVLAKLDGYYDVAFYYPFYGLALLYGKHIMRIICDFVDLVPSWCILMLVVIYYVLVLRHFTWSDTVYVHNINVYHWTDVYQSLYTFAISFSSLIIHLILFMSMAKKCRVYERIYDFISDAGKYTLQIYIIHILVMHSCLKMFLSTSKNLLTILIAVSIYIVSYFLSKFLMQNRYTKYLFKLY